MKKLILTLIMIITITNIHAVSIKNNTQFDVSIEVTYSAQCNGIPNTGVFQHKITPGVTIDISPSSLQLMDRTMCQTDIDTIKVTLYLKDGTEISRTLSPTTISGRSSAYQTYTISSNYNEKTILSPAALTIR